MLPYAGAVMDQPYFVYEALKACQDEYEALQVAQQKKADATQERDLEKAKKVTRG